MKLFTYNRVLAVIPLLCMGLGLITACGVKSTENPFEPVDPALLAIDPVALERLLERSREIRSDALVAVHDGRLVADYRSSGILERLSSERIEARGYLGQHLLILRDQRLVAVRQIRYRNHRKSEEDDFRDFTQRVMELLSPTD